MASAWVELVSRPRLVGEALRAAWAFRTRGSMLPSRALLRWRIATAYGDAGHAVAGEDLVRFLEWRRAVRRAYR